MERSRPNLHHRVLTVTAVASSDGMAAGAATDAENGAETIAIGMTGGLTETMIRVGSMRAGVLAGTRAITDEALSSGSEAARRV